MDDALIQTLTSDHTALWTQYIVLESQGRRKAALQVLQVFIEALQADTEQRRRDFSEIFCVQVADEGRILPMREPLFARIIGPFLVSIYQREEAAAPRWIAHFSGYFFNMPESRRLLNLPQKSVHDLWMEALAHDPDNAQIRKKLMQTMVNQFQYAVHEVPAGVLFGFDGATVEECQDWQTDLALFRDLVQKQGEAKFYAESIRYWDFHFRGYADYLTHREQYQNYADYIKRHWEAQN